MHVLMINGSPNKHGCTFTALSEVASQLEKNGVGSSIVHIGAKAIQGCTDCRKCVDTGYCVFTKDRVNECVDLMKTADGLVVGSPVYFGSIAGSLGAFLDRMFFRKYRNFNFWLKPAAAVASCRRAGSVEAVDRLNKYFMIAQMPVVSSQYWNMVYGATPDEVRQDLEGLQIMRTLGDNMAWLLKCIAHAKDAVPLPRKEPLIRTSFIRQV